MRVIGGRALSRGAHRVRRRSGAGACCSRFLFRVDIRYAIGASLVSVIATSSGAAAAYVKEGIFQHSHWNVSGDCYHAGRATRGVSRPLGCRRGSDMQLILGSCCCTRRIFAQGRPGGASESSAERTGDAAAAEWQFYGPRRAAQQYNVQNVADRVRPDVWRGNAVGAAGDRVGRGEGAGDGPGDAASRSRFRPRPATS